MFKLYLIKIAFYEIISALR